MKTSRGGILLFLLCILFFIVPLRSEELSSDMHSPSFRPSSVVYPFLQQEISLYDERGRLLQKKHYAEVEGVDRWVMDAEKHITTYRYDMFGNRIARNHPDAGLTTWQYDPAGNLVARQTANYSKRTETIKYAYLFHRLTEVCYPYHTENNVLYLYDASGRIARRIDGTGSEDFVYDCLGNIAQSTRRIVIPTERVAYTFRTQYKYDSFGRMRNIIYPDGEVLHYGYTTGGLLKSVVGVKPKGQNIYLWG